MAFFDPNVEKLKSRRNTKALIKALKCKTTRVQVEAARALGDLNVKAAVDPLIVALTDWNDDVQIAAAEALGKLGRTKAIKPLIFSLRENNNRLKKTVIYALSQIGYEAVHPLIELLQESEGQMREHVLSAIIELGEIAFKPIKNLLYDNKFSQRHLLLNVFAKLGNNDSIDVLIDILNTDYEYDLRQQAGQHLIALGEKAVPKLLETAMHPDSDLYLMLNILSKIGDKRCREFFIENLTSLDSSIRLMSANGLEKSGWLPRNNETGAWFYIAKKQWQKLIEFGPVAMTPLGKVVDDKNDNIRNAAIDAMSQIGKSGTDVLLASLKEKQPEARLHAAAALGKLAEKKAIEGLKKCLSDTDSRVRRAAVESLGRINDELCINPIIMALKDTDAYVRKTAVMYIRDFNDARTIGLFIPMLGDPAPVVCQEIVKSFIMMGEVVVDHIIDALELPNSNIKRYAAVTLGGLKDKKAVPPLLRLLGNTNWVVRKSAVVALGEIADKRSINQLVEMLEDPKDEVALAAVKALADIGQPAVTTLLPLLIGRKKNNYAILTLKEMKEDAIKPLLDMLRHEDSQIRATVVKVLDLIGWQPQKDETGAAFWVAKQDWGKSVEVGEQAVQPLIEVLTDDEMWHRKNAAEHLGKLKDNKAVDSLIQSLSDKYWNVREAAVNSLVKMGRPAVEPLISALLSEKKESFSSITDALAKIGDRRAVAPLVYILKDKRRPVRLAAAQALEKMNALEGNNRCIRCGKIIYKTLTTGDFCPFCNDKLEIREKEELTILDSID